MQGCVAARHASLLGPTSVCPPSLLHTRTQSIFHLAYLRGLFPDGSFKGCDMKNLDGGGGER